MGHIFYDNKTKWPEEFDVQNGVVIGPTANLKGANLSGADLSRAHLSNADLSRALYDKATQSPKGFRYQNCGVSFIGPNANLQGSDWREADLS